MLWYFASRQGLYRSGGHLNNFMVYYKYSVGVNNGKTYIAFLKVTTYRSPNDLRAIKDKMG